MKATAAAVQAGLAHGEVDIGALVYWRDLSGVRIEREVFRTGFRAAGLGAALAKDPSPEKLLNTAAGTANRKQDREQPKVKVELKAKGTHAVYAVLARRDESDGRIKYLEEATVAVDRERGGTPIVNDLPGTPVDDGREAVIGRVLDEYADLQVNAHGQEVSEALTRAMAVMEALPLRTGTYFVPASKLGAVRALREFVELHTTATVTSWVIRGSDENTATARRDAREAMLERIEDLVSEVKEFVDTTPVEDAAAKSVNAAVRKFKELDGKVQLYADILGDYQAELQAAIAEARQRLLGAYLGDAEDDAAAA